MTPWLLLDYGDVISLPYDESVRRDVAGRLELTPDELEEKYWAQRRDLDSGLDSAAYWTGVAGRDVLAEEAAELDRVDQSGWAQVNDGMLDLIEEQRANGVRLAILSNAPHVQADVFDEVAWAAGFEHVFASARLGMVKPDPEIFEHVLVELGARADEVTFVDDRRANVDAAAAAGMRAILFTGVEKLQIALET